MKLVAIGGGEIRRLETFYIDRKIVELTGKRKPKALFLPTSQALGLVNATFSPHHLQEAKYRMNNLKKIMGRTPGVGLAVDDFAAIEINGDQFRILKSKGHATVKRVYYSKGKLIKESTLDFGSFNFSLPTPNSRLSDT